MNLAQAFVALASAGPQYFLKCVEYKIFVPGRPIGFL